MLTPKKIFDFMHHYSVTQSAIVIAARAAGAEKLTDGIFSFYLRGRTELSPETLAQVEVGMGGLANLIHYSNPIPVDFSTARVLPVLRKHVREHQEYLRAKAAEDATA